MQVQEQVLFGHQLFGNVEFDIPDVVSPFVPESNPLYQFSKEHLRVVLNWLFNGSMVKRGLYIFGPSGSGKTSIIEEVCARMRKNLHYVCATEDLEMPDLIGQFQLVGNGVMQFVLGPLAIAYRDGDVFLLDEMDRWDVPSKFYGILEGKPITLPTGEMIRCHPDFRLFATGNTNGAGDRSGKYRRTRQQNEALMQRLDALKMNYPAPEDEEKAIKAFLMGISEFDEATCLDFSTKMVRVANMVRQLGMTDQLTGTEIEIDFGVRTIKSWCENMINFGAVPGVSALVYGLERAVLCRASEETAEAVSQIVKDVFGTV